MDITHAHRRRWHRRIAHVLALLFAASFGLLLLDRLFPLPLPDPGKSGVVVTARDGRPLRAFADADAVWRYPVRPEDVSPLYVEAVVGYEDRWFWRHPGVNPVAMLRAAMQWAGEGRVVSGGSTLTMQVARIIDPHPRTPLGKLRQSLRALQLEWHLSKPEILALYLNHAPFGGTIEGVEAASWAYLGKPAKNLSHAEAALLAVLPQMPSRLRPDRHPEAARRARDKVLDRLVQQGVWTRAEAADARIEAVVARRLQPPLSAALLAQRLRSEHPGRTHITSSIDAELQQRMEDRVLAYLAQLPERTSAALLVVDNRSMEALAYVGSGEFGDAARLGHVDMVRAVRSPGSTLKPFLYGLAIDDGLIHSESLLLDAPQNFGDYRPQNFDPAFNGPVAAADALRLSLNVPAVDLLDRVGPARFAARLANGGLSLQFPKGAPPNLSLILGGTGASLEQLVAAHAALNRGGLAARVRYTPRSAGQGNEDRRLMSAGAAWIVRDILERHDRPGDHGDTFVGSRGRRVAWKTGTSYGFRDAWALGSSSDHTIGVWIGRPDGTPMPGQYGALTALPLMFAASDSLPASARRHESPASVGVARQSICWPLGLPPDPAAPAPCQRQREAWHLVGSLPPTWPEREAKAWSSGLITLEVEAKTGLRLSGSCRHPHERVARHIARWPSLATPWLPATERRESAIPALSPDCDADALAAMETLRIDGPAEGTTLARAPNSDTPVRLRLRALGTQGRVRWLLNGVLVADTTASGVFSHAFDQPGTVRIVALADSGAWAELNLRVLR